MRYVLAFLMICVLFFTNSMFAQQKQKPEEAKNSFRQLRQTFLQPQTGRTVDPQTAERERSQSVKTWLQRNNWRELPVQEQAWLTETLAGPDLVNKSSFSVRWTGQLRAPANGVYTFSPFSAAGTEGVMRLWIDDQLVMDSSIATSDDLEAKAEPTEGKAIAATKETAVKETVKPQGGVSLTAGKPVSFKLEYVRTPIEKKPGVMRLPGYPAAILEWQSDVMEKQVVPSSVFTPPAGSEEKQGLLGEYYADPNFGKRGAQRIDPNVDFLWDVGRVATEHRDTQREIVSQTVAKLTSPGFLASLDVTESKDFVQKQLPQLFAVMSASERVAVLQAVAEQPELLKLLSFQQMVGALRWYSTLPDQAPSIDLLVKWSQTSQPPIAKPGFAPGRSPGGYLTQNVEPYFRLARLFIGDDVDQKIEMLSEHVANEDGSCNLTIAYVLCCICRMADKPMVISKLTDERLRGEGAEELPGDVRASWHLAEAFKREAIYDNEFLPGGGIGSVEKALEGAESEEMRFRLTGELAARLIALDRADEATSMVMSLRDQFPEEDQQAQMDAWVLKGKDVKKYYEELRAKKAEENDTFAVDSYTVELNRRAGIAEKRGEKTSLQRYHRMVRNLEEAKVEREKKKSQQ